MTNHTEKQDEYGIVQRISDLRERIGRAQAMSPHGQSVTLMAVTKTVDAERINIAIEQGGIRCIGENRVQELCEKYPFLHLDGVSVHLIGTLQSNKVKYIIDKVDMIHSLDGISLAKEIEKQAAKHGRVIDCLIEINIGEELSKGGIAPTQDALFSFYDEVSAFPHIRVRGVMTIAPNSGDNEQYHRYFSKTKDLFDRLCEEKLPADRDWEPVLSMGMSGSFEEAIRCGSHVVRVGSGIFGARK